MLVSVTKAEIAGGYNFFLNLSNSTENNENYTLYKNSTHRMKDSTENYKNTSGVVDIVKKPNFNNTS